jgi:hypothetical protein
VTAVATLRWLQLQLQRQVTPMQAHLHVQFVRTAAAATSEQLEALATFPQSMRYCSML